MKSEYLKETELIDGGVYELDSRNLVFGVWHSDTHEFEGVRTKFGVELLDTEWHWDYNGEGRLGTAKPIRFIEMIPEDVSTMRHLKGKEQDGKTF